MSRSVDRKNGKMDVSGRRGGLGGKSCFASVSMVAVGLSGSNKWPCWLFHTIPGFVVSSSDRGRVATRFASFLDWMSYVDLHLLAYIRTPENSGC